MGLQQGRENHITCRSDIEVESFRKGFFKACLFCLALTLSACTTSSIQNNDQIEESFKYEEIVLKQKERARSFEDSGDLYKAFVCLSIVAELRPADKVSLTKITELRERLRKKVERHFKLGLDYYQEGSMKAARKEFLIVLNHDPSHSLALDYLKKGFSPEFKRYQVKLGDTLRTVALGEYNDEDLDFLLAEMNALSLDAELIPGTELNIVQVEPPRYKSPDDTDPTATDYQNVTSLGHDKNSENALYKCNGKKHEECAGLAINILMDDPNNMEARTLLNKSLYAISEDLIAEQQYYDALDTLKKIDNSYRDVQEKISTLEMKVSKISEEHYKNGVKCFIQEDFVGALVEWEKTLALNPEHEKAKRGVKNASKKLGK